MNVCWFDWARAARLGHGWMDGFLIAPDTTATQCCREETVKMGNIQSSGGGLEKKEEGVAHTQPVSRSCHIVSVSARS